MTGTEVKLLRERFGVTQAELARRVGMARAQLCKIERGTSTLRDATLRRLCAALGASMDMLADAERARRSPYAATRCENLKFGELRERLERLESPIDRAVSVCKVPALTTLPLVHAYLRRPRASVHLARAMRHALGVDSAPLYEMEVMLEFANVRLHVVDLPKGVSSVGFWRGESGTLTVVLSKADTPERRRFRLASELAAACLFRSKGDMPIADTKNERRFQGEFASEFLMPAAVVEDWVAKAGIRPDAWTLEQLCYFKAHFGVSAEAFAIRLNELGLLTSALLKRLRANLRAYYKSHPRAMEPPPPALSHPGSRWEVMG